MMTSSFNPSGARNFWHNIGMKKETNKQLKFVFTLQFWLDISPLASHYACYMITFYFVFMSCFVNVLIL